MANEYQLNIIKGGPEYWNFWRRSNPDVPIDLSGADLSGKELNNINLRQSNLTNANFAGAKLYKANFASSILSGSNFLKANLTAANFLKAELENATLVEALLLKADFTQANLLRANLSRACLDLSIFIETVVQDATLRDCSIYGISVWKLKGNFRKQINLKITSRNEDVITVDDLQVAQFIYLLLDNTNFRNVIDTIVSKAVLILGRFTEERKSILTALHFELRKKNYLPILFDFAGPDSRDVSETVATLAHLARFIIADITDAKSILQELRGIVPDMPSLPVQPLLLSSQEEPGMFNFFHRFPWVLNTLYYKDINELITHVDKKIIGPLEEKFLEVKPR